VAILGGVEAIDIAEARADSDAVRGCFERYYAELDARLAQGFDVAAALPLAMAELTPPHGLVLLARRAGQAVGCGALKLVDADLAEVKRLWVDAEIRGRGIGGRLLDELEARAAASGRLVVRLDSNRSLHEALELYRRHGYHEVAPFNAEPFADHWFEKTLGIQEPRR
jgi:ribosomal protein S18 acetylase RimI-like enzyme